MTGHALAPKAEAINNCNADVRFQCFKEYSLEMETRYGTKFVLKIGVIQNMLANARELHACNSRSFLAPPHQQLRLFVLCIVCFVRRNKCVYNQHVFLHRLGITISIGSNNGYSMV